MFDEKNLLLFNLFVKPQSQKDDILHLMNIDITSKLKNKYPNLNLKKFDLSDIIYLNLQLVSGMKIKTKFFNKLKDLSYQEYEVYEKRYKDLISNNENIFNKEPYSYFFNHQNNEEILKNEIKLQYFLHVQLHLLYYILFFVYQNFSQYSIQRPKIFEKLKEINNQTLNHSIDSKKLLNILISFFKKNLKKNPNLISLLNESSFEILLHLIILNYSHTKKLSFKFIFKDPNKKIRTFQTLIMFNSLYKKYDEYSFCVSEILNYFVTKNYDNIFILIKILDISNLGIDKCRIVLTKMFSNDIIKNNKVFKKVIYNFIQAILIVKNKKNDVLTHFLTEILSGILTSNDNEDYFILIFDLFFGTFLKKFLIEINSQKLSFQQNNIISKLKENYSSFFSEKFINYIYYLNTYYGVYIKKIFPKILFVYSNSFNSLFSIFNSFNSKPQFYYDNIKNPKLSKSRNTIISYLLMNFNLIDNDILIKKVYNYYIKPKIIIDTKSYPLFKNEIEYDEENNKIKIQFTCIKNVLSNLELLSSNEYKINIINSIKNIFKNYYPFNSIDFLSSLLQKLLPQEVEEEENYFYFNDNYILNTEDEEEINHNIEIINKNIIDYKETMITIIFEKFSKLTDNDLYNINNPNELLYNILYIFFKNGNIKMMDSCLNCISFLYMSKKESFNLENIINYLNLLNKISDSYSNEKKIMDNINELKLTLLHAEKEKNKINEKEDKCGNQLDNKIKKSLSDVIFQKNKFNKIYSIKKLMSIFNIKNNSKESLNISMKCMDDLMKFLKDELINSNNDIFYSSLVMKLSVNIFISIKSNEFLRNYYLKLFNELLENFLKNNLEINIQISSKLFEILVKIIKKLKGKTFLIALDILKILFQIFEKYKNSLNSLCITSSITICAYLVEYSHNEISNYISTIILTGINYLKSNSSSIEEKRASAFLLNKILSRLSNEELKDFSERIFNSIKIAYENSKDNVLTFHLMKCLNYYE